LAAFAAAEPEALDLDPEVVCNLPRDQGTICGSVRWYWNEDRETCKKFWYRGNAGNGNNYQSKDECLEDCPITPGCSDPVDQGNSCHEERYFYHKDKNECRKFIFHGTLGNDNNFKTHHQCELVCGEKGGKKKTRRGHGKKKRHHEVDGKNKDGPKKRNHKKEEENKEHHKKRNHKNEEEKKHGHKKRNHKNEKKNHHEHKKRNHHNKGKKRHQQQHEKKEQEKEMKKEMESLKKQFTEKEKAEKKDLMPEVKIESPSSELHVKNHHEHEGLKRHI
jgi:hypothetical protein